MNNCHCIKGVFNFIIETPDNKNIIYTNLSDWMFDETHSIPDFYKIKITLPGSSITKEVQVAAKSKTSTRIEASDLGLTCIPDGPYKFSVGEEDGGCGTDYWKEVVVIPNLYCCYKKLVAIEGVTPESNKILDHMEAALSNSEIQNIKAANEDFRMAKKLLERIKCDCICKN